jgi:mRNA-degrading endonuclease RelE of RelBE toxin-antitoxin system
MLQDFDLEFEIVLKTKLLKELERLSKEVNRVIKNEHINLIVKNPRRNISKLHKG